MKEIHRKVSTAKGSPLIWPNVTPEFDLAMKVIFLGYSPGTTGLPRLP